MFGISELAILLIVVLIVIGAKKLPDLARNAGKAARILKSEAKAMKSEGSATGPQAQRTAPGVIRAQPVDGAGVRPGDGTGGGPARPV
ncbi:twin-arginine translocase TatA/TatE family subunit [Streptomyces sp. NBC_00654]|uniref:twin-arginine translocase TatA/TatE family subunit n=1 Tax=Streptomyces sp. NBC_00654 TaxID=2975799 RepID=UPI002256D14F|nr:twin-arginine translocase TatA/TatE family subunit [Streptomyces sp. NBC_00654]MCX4970403.1 twin-arginine translocase TatA/TatE family subunit [Streptomyces sp. NBC_00654]